MCKQVDRARRISDNTRLDQGAIMSRAVCVIDLPGLSRGLLDFVPASSQLGRWVQSQRISTLIPPWPALTCPVQATLTTGVLPSQHGIVANGLATYRSVQDQALVDLSSFPTYRRDLSFWEQSNQLVQARRFWQDSGGRSRYKTALLFFQNSMPGFSGSPSPAADIIITPKPEHGPDGKISSLLWTEPRELVTSLFEQLGPFPLMNYWGPMAGIASSQWIAKAAACVWTHHRPQLQLTYIPHLDYDLQRFGPDSEQAIKAVADVSVALDPLLDAVLPDGELIVISEYSMQRVHRCVQPNRLLAEAGLVVTRETPDGRLVDYGRSKVFVLADHQIAHLYARDTTSLDAARGVLSGLPVSEVSAVERIDHPRAGDMQLAADPNTWFDYRWWSRSEDAPSFAATVDIHRKPGYDPLELFFDPATKAIGQDPSFVKGSHGRADGSSAVLIHRPIDALPDPSYAVEFPRVVARLLK